MYRNTIHHTEFSQHRNITVSNVDDFLEGKNPDSYGNEIEVGITFQLPFTRCVSKHVPTAKTIGI